MMMKKTKQGILFYTTPNFFSGDSSVIFTQIGKFTVIDFLNSQENDSSYHFLKLKKQDAENWFMHNIKKDNMEQFSDWLRDLRFEAPTSEKYKSAFHLAWTIAREVDNCPLEVR